MNALHPLKLPLCALAAAMAIATLPAAASAGSIHLDGLGSQPAHHQFIVAMRDGSTLARAEERMAAHLRQATAILGTPTRATVARRLAVGPMVVRTDRALDPAEAEQLLRALAGHPDVDYVQTDALMQVALHPDHPRLGQQWGFGTTAASLDIRGAWDLATGRGQVVAVLDTGITAHPDLDGNILPGHDFISDPDIAGDGDGRDGDASDVGDFFQGRRSSWHGTHVAGTVAALTDNGMGVAGTASGARVQPIRVLGRGGGFASDIADAMVWAAGVPVQGVPDNPTPAKVLNLSLGSYGSCDPLTRSAIQMANANGATVVIAAGNSNDDVSRYRPANCPGAISVAATTAAGARAGFSNHGATMTIAAPGDTILSTLNMGVNEPGLPGYAAYSGTSMAAPHVAGVVALMQSAAPRPLTSTQVAGILRATARPLPVPCPLGCGAGIASALGAVTMAIDGKEPGPDPRPEPDPDPSELQNGMQVMIAGDAGSNLAYTVNVPAGSQQLIVSISGGDGNADLYTRYAEAPTDTTFNCRPQSAGNNESCVRLYPGIGHWFVRVRGISDYSGVTLVATVK